jgi:hypothetical protein
MHGRGIYTWASGDQFIGEFYRDSRDGKGTLTLCTGEIYESTWEEGSMKKEKNSSAGLDQGNFKKKEKDNETIRI